MADTGSLEPYGGTVKYNGDSPIQGRVSKEDGEWVNVAEVLSKNIDVQVQDQYTEIIDLYMCNNTGTTNPTSSILIDAKSITVDDVTGAAVGDCIDISENGRIFQAIIKDITGNVITFNAPSDQAFTTEAIVCFGEWNMNYDGSVTTLDYFISPPTGVKWDITRIIIGMSDEDPMDDGKFGGISSLANGVVLRVKDGYTKNIFVASNNGGLRERSFDIEYADKAPAGEYGFGCRRTFGGQSKNGVVIRLDGDTGDKLSLLIQDDLTGLTKLAVVVQGHVVED